MLRLRLSLVLAFLAVLALLTTPVAAAAAQAACGQIGSSAAASMDMSATRGMAEAGSQKASVDPCCDHGASHNMDHKGCASACATSCAVTAAAPGPVVASISVFATAQLTPARLAPASPHEPAGLMRPPKSMA
jgi:hypothetical protein